MIKENILGKCLRCCSSCGGPRISPLSPQYGCPRPSLLTITSGLEKDQQNKTEVLFHHSMLQYSGVVCTCFEHSNLFKVNVAGRTGHPAKGTPHDYGREPTRRARTRRAGRPRHSGGVVRPRRVSSFDARHPERARALDSERRRPAEDRHPTTSFLTATTLIYAIGAGVTAAAGTRLALQWVLVKGFKVYSFQSRGLGRVPYRYFSSLPPRAGSG